MQWAESLGFDEIGLASQNDFFKMYFIFPLGYWRTLTFDWYNLILIWYAMVLTASCLVVHGDDIMWWAGLGSNTFYQIQIQIQIQKFGFFKYKYKYKYFAQLCFKYKYKYIDSNTNTDTNTFNQIYLPKLFGSKIGQFFKSQNICSWSVFPNV